MNSGQPAGPSQPKRRRFIFLKILSGLAVLVVVAVAALLLWSRSQTNAIRKEYKARGLPTSPEEFNAWYEPVPDAENAALGFLASAKVIVPPEGEESTLPIVGDKEHVADTWKPANRANAPVDSAALQLAEGYLAKNARALELAHTAAKLQRARYPVNLAEQPATDVKHLELVRDAARLLWFEGRIKAEKGDTAGCVRSFAAAAAISRSLAEEPLLISQLVVVAIDSEFTKALCDVLSVARFKPAELAELTTLIANDDAAKSFARAIGGEASLGLFSNMPGNPLSNPIYTLDRRAYADKLMTLIDISAMNLREAVVSIEKLNEDRTPGFDKLRPMTSILSPTLERAHVSFARAQVTKDLARVVLAIETYRTKHNALPENLAALTPDLFAAVPQDPYSDGAYLYRKEDSGYAVYSVGPDHEDGNADKMHDPWKGDITLRVAR
jgi:hypothetical protein